MIYYISKSMTSIILSVIIGFSVGIARAGSTDWVPKKFVATFETENEAWQVEILDGALFYTTTRNSEPRDRRKIVPTAVRWQEFRAKLDAIGLWKWQPSYSSPVEVLHGAEWSLAIEYADKHLHATGLNGYPDENGNVDGPEPTKAFNEYLRSIKDLLGEKQLGKK